MALLEGSCLGCRPFGTGDLTQSHFAVPEDNDPLYIMADHWGRVTLVFEDADSGYEGMIQLRSLDHLLGCHPGEPWFALCNPGLAIPPRCSPLVCGLYHNDQEGPSAGLCVASSLQIPKRCPQQVPLYPYPWTPGELMGWCIVLRNPSRGDRSGAFLLSTRKAVAWIVCLAFNLSVSPRVLHIFLTWTTRLVYPLTHTLVAFVSHLSMVSMPTMRSAFICHPFSTSWRREDVDICPRSHLGALSH